MRSTPALLAIAALVAAGTAHAAASPSATAKGEARLEKLLAGRVAGKPVDCIDLHRINSTEVIDGTAIVYEDGRKLYVNRPEGGGDSLDSDDILLTKTWSSQLCSIDVVRLIDRGSQFEHGFVSLSKFVPYTKVKPVPLDHVE